MFFHVQVNLMTNEAREKEHYATSTFFKFLPQKWSYKCFISEVAIKILQPKSAPYNLDNNSSERGFSATMP